MALYWGGTKGGSDRVDCGNVTVGDSGDMSLAAWVRLPNNFTGAASVIDRRGSTATQHRFWILCVGDGAGAADFRFIRKHTTTDAVAISTQAYNTDDSTWYFVAGTHVSGAAPKLFVGTQTTDLAEVSYSSQTAPVGTLRTGAQPLNLGRRPTNTSTGFGGAIAVVGLFDTALSVGELRAMRLGGLRTILSRTDLVHCWAPYLNGTSGTVYDIGARSIIAGTTIDGTISGTLTQIENPGLLRGFPAVGPADWRPVASAATTDALTADDVESASEVSAPNIGQEHALNATDVESATEVSAPAIGQVHALTATSVESASEVSAPVLTDVAANVDVLNAEDIESASEVSAPALGQVHALAANDVESVSEVSSPAINAPSVAQRGDDAFRSNGARERFWRRKAEEWLEDHLEQTLRATKKKKSARKRAGTRIVAAANAAAAEMPEIAPKIDLIARFAAQLSAPDPDLMAIATAVAAQLEQVETEKRTRRRKRDLEAVLLLAA